jgi:hypothetical protein
LVTAVEREGQRTWKITAEGIDELGAWWQAVPADEPPPRDELLLKVLMAVDTGRADHALAVIADQREAVMGLLQVHQRAARRLFNGRGDTATAADRLAHDALVVRAEADLRWLDRCEERLTADRPPRAGRPRKDPA